MTDQHRFDAFSKFSSYLKTPNFEKIINEGIYFSNAYTSTPSCTPARAGILTGKSPWYHGMLGYGKIAEHYDVELPRLMHDSGFDCISIGKNHFGWNKTANAGVAHGYDDTTQICDGVPEYMDNYDQWFKKKYPNLDPLQGDPSTGLGWNDFRGKVYQLPKETHPTAWVGEKTVEQIKKFKNSKTPFFLKSSFHRPHSPYDPPLEFYDKVDIEEMPHPKYSNQWDKRFQHEYQKESDAKHDIWNGNFTDSQIIQHTRKCYMANIQFIDEQVGKIIQTLKDEGMYENTVIIYSSDHGDMLGDHYLFRKAYSYEYSSHIPLFIRWPENDKRFWGIKRGTKSDKIVELRDILPTILDSVNISYKELDIQGDSLLNLIQYPEYTKWRKYIDLEHTICYNDFIHWNALTDGTWKYIFNAYDGSENLFNLKNDPMEMRDYSKEFSEIVAYWREKMVQQFEREKRGEKQVKDGKLQIRRELELYSPYYPGYENINYDKTIYDLEAYEDRMNTDGDYESVLIIK